MTKNDGGAAFPVHGGHPGDDPRNQILGGGLTIRDWFAGQIMAGICTRCGFQGGPWEELARHSYQAADALLTAREAE